MVVARWDGALDLERVASILDGRIDPNAAVPVFEPLEPAPVTAGFEVEAP
jgi:hypothetical protein